MEYVSERERFENQALTHDVPLTPEIIALRALMDHIENEKREEECDG